MTSSNVHNFRKNPRVQIICNALTDSLCHMLMNMILCVDCLPLNVVVMLLAFMLDFWCMLTACCWSHLHTVIYVEWMT